MEEIKRGKEEEAVKEARDLAGETVTAVTGDEALLQERGGSWSGSGEDEREVDEGEGEEMERENEGDGDDDEEEEGEESGGEREGEGESVLVTLPDTTAIAYRPPPPYLSYERNGPDQRFYDPSSTADKGRFRVYDARDFDPKSMYRKPDPVCSEVTQLRGVRRDDGLELVITLLFDRSRFTEEQAS
eukprot:gene1694-1986_t